MKKRLRLTVVLPILLAAASVCLMAANHAADVATQTPKVVWGDTQCLRCHTDAKTLKVMQWKKDDTNFCQSAYDQILKQQGGVMPTAKSWSTGYKRK